MASFPQSQGRERFIGIRAGQVSASTLPAPPRIGSTANYADRIDGELEGDPRSLDPDPNRNELPWRDSAELPPSSPSPIVFSDRVLSIDESTISAPCSIFYGWLAAMKRATNPLDLEFVFRHLMELLQDPLFYSSVGIPYVEFFLADEFRRRMGLLSTTRSQLESDLGDNGDQDLQDLDSDDDLEVNSGVELIDDEVATPIVVDSSLQIAGDLVYDLFDEWCERGTASSTRNVIRRPRVLDHRSMVSTIEGKLYTSLIDFVKGNLGLANDIKGTLNCIDVDAMKGAIRVLLNGEPPPQSFLAVVFDHGGASTSQFFFKDSGDWDELSNPVAYTADSGDEVFDESPRSPSVFNVAPYNDVVDPGGSERVRQVLVFNVVPYNGVFDPGESKRDQRNFVAKAKSIDELIEDEPKEEWFRPILKKWHPLAAGLAVAILHSCYGNELKQYVSDLAELTVNTFQVLRAAELRVILLELGPVFISFDARSKRYVFDPGGHEGNPSECFAEFELPRLSSILYSIPLQVKVCSSQSYGRASIQYSQRHGRDTEFWYSCCCCSRAEVTNHVRQVFDPGSDRFYAKCGHLNLAHKVLILADSPQHLLLWPRDQLRQDPTSVARCSTKYRKKHQQAGLASSSVDLGGQGLQRGEYCHGSYPLQHIPCTCSIKPQLPYKI